MSLVPAATLKGRFEEALHDNDLSDCVFIVGKEKCRIEGHRVVFGLSSPVFRCMLFGGSLTTFTFRIEDVEADEFRGMKQFFYTDTVNFTSCLYACSLYLASCRYVLPHLISMCVQYIKDNISVTEVIDVYEFSRLNNIPDIEKICTAFFQAETSEIMSSERFLSCDMDTLDTILRLDSMNVKSELEVFKYAEKWVLAEAARRNIDKENLSEHFNFIKELIRFSTMDKEQYEEGPAKSDLLTAEDKLAIAHRLLGFKSKDQVSLRAVTEHRIFTEKVEEDEKRLQSIII